MNVEEMQDKLATALGLLDQVAAEVFQRSAAAKEADDSTDPHGSAPVRSQYRDAKRAALRAKREVAALSDAVDRMGAS